MTGLDLTSVQGDLHRWWVPWSLEYLDACESTQDVARAALRRGAGHGLAVVANWQRAGRGRHGRSWTAPPGLALLLSVILVPPPGWLGMLPLLAGVAVADGIEASCGLRCDLKWPNDVLVDDRKVAGILAERPPGPAVVLGVGVNVNLGPGDLPQETPATSLLLLTGKAVVREGLLGSILNSLDAWYGKALEGGAAVVLAAWRARASMLGRPVEVTGETVIRRGTAEGIDEEGGLILRYDDGRREVLLAGDIRLIRTAGRERA